MNTQVPQIKWCGTWEFPGSLVIKDLVLSILWPGLDPWPGNFGMPQEQTEKKKKLHLQWIDNKALLYSTENYVQLL